MSLKLFESAENYLEAILILKKELGEVRAIDIAKRLSFSKPSVSIALKQFRENGLVSIGDGGFIALTKKGMEIASKIYERHTVLADFLMKIGVSEDTARYDGCRIEHYISNESFERIREHYLSIHGN